ncbi:MAG: exodeoxyribonuclease III [Saprospiraceae bacterium]
MKIATYNVNGIRAAIKKGFVEWLKDGDFDIVCLQEVKAMEEQVDLTPFTELGYKWTWHAAEKKGYSGVATFFKEGLSPKLIKAGCGIDTYDSEGRILRTDFEDFALLNCYFPSGTTGTTRQDVKMDFLRDFMPFLDEIRKEQPNVIVVGDYNIAHTENDIHNPKTNKKSSGFLPEERAWVDEYLATGMTDAFRHLHPETTEYSWWSYRAGARGNNKGWRIDYQMVTEPMQARLSKAYHMKDDMQSDHCALVVEYKK